jgi:hypothetical protein
MLETAGWAERLPPCKLLHFESWKKAPDDADQPLAKMVQSRAIWRTILPDRR